jgi:hypothetical protein
MSNNQIQITSNNPIRSDSFRVEFLKFPTNHDNILGRQVKSIGLPEISFDTTPLAAGGYVASDKGIVRFADVQASFACDEGGILMGVLMGQVMRQVNRTKDNRNQKGNHNTRDYKFDVKISIMNARQEITQTYILLGCFISRVQLPEMAYEQDSDLYATIVLSYDNVDYEFAGAVDAVLDLDDSRPVFPT